MKLLVGLAIGFLLLVGMLLALPFLLNLNTYQAQYTPLLEKALNRKVEVQDLRLTIWPRLGFRVGGLTILDDPSFNTGPFASCMSLDIGVKLLPLLSRRVEVEEIVLRHPAITVITNQAGVMNVSTIGAATSAPPSSPTTTAPGTRPSPQEPDAGPFPGEPGAQPAPAGDPWQLLALFAVERVSIDGGTLTYRDLSAAPAMDIQLQDLELVLKSVLLGESPSIHLKATVLPSNVPITLDGQLGPLVERVEIARYDFSLGLGNTALSVKGALVDGLLTATLTAPAINTADLPVALPFQKPVLIKDLLVSAQAPYPLTDRASPLELADISQLSLALIMGHSSVKVAGTVVHGQADVTVSSSSINSGDLPIALPLDKPVHIKDLVVAAQTRMPFTPTASPLEIADVSDLRLGLVMGTSMVTVKGHMRNGHAHMAVSSPSVHTADLPVRIGLVKSVELKQLRMNADVKGQQVRLSNASFQLFSGQVKADGGLTMGSPAPPFQGKMKIEGVQLGPALEAVSPNNQVSMSGTAAMDLAVAGRGLSMAQLTRALEGPGHLRIKNGRIEGISLTEEALTLLNAAGISPDRIQTTVFSTIETDVLIKQGLINVQRLFMDSHDFQAAGTGTMAFDQALNLAVTLNLSQALSQKLAASSPVTKLALKEGRLKLPLVVTGTVQQPSYLLDVKALTANVQEQAQEKAKETIKGLLDGTTTPRDFERQGKELLKGLFKR